MHIAKMPVASLLRMRAFIETVTITFMIPIFGEAQRLHEIHLVSMEIGAIQEGSKC